MQNPTTDPANKELNIAFDKMYHNDQVILSIEKLYKQEVEKHDKQRKEQRRVMEEFEQSEQVIKNLKDQIDKIRSDVVNLEVELKADIEREEKLRSKEELRTYIKEKNQQNRDTKKNLNNMISMKNKDFIAKNQKFYEIKEEKDKV